MEVRIRGRGVQVDEGIRAYALGKVDRSTRFFDRLGDVDITLFEVTPPERGQRFRAEIATRSARHDLRAEGEGDTVERALDAAADRFVHRLRRLSERLTDRRRQTTRSPEPVDRLDSGSANLHAGDGIPEIVRVRGNTEKPMTPEDAALVMEQRGYSFLVFTNAETGRFGVLYRRNDGRMGLIEPE